MGFALDSGYTPLTIEAILHEIMLEINEQFNTDYTDETFLGTNWYKYSYVIAQKIQLNEIKTSEIFSYLQQYFAVTNESIQRPVATAPGIIELFQREGFVASLKPPEVGDAGKIYICVDTDDDADDYDDVKLAINTLIKDSVAQGIVSQGTESSTIVLSNGQNFDYKFNLPDVTEPLLRLTLTLSDNNQVVIATPEAVKQLLIDNIEAKYRLGRDFEPQRYFTTADAPWTSEVLLEWSDDAGSSWSNDIFEAAYDDLFDIKLENIELVEA